MSKQEDKFAKRRLTTSYFTSLTSITLVLFIIGLFGLLIVQAKGIRKHVMENVMVNIYFNKAEAEADIIKLQKTLDASNGIKSTKYISPEQGAKIYGEELGEDFLLFLEGENPIHASLEVHLDEAYANVDSLKNFSVRVEKNPIVEEVRYPEDYVKTINDNMAKISFFLMLFSGLLLLISIVLINNTIRLSIYAHRFIIRTMKLIGATKGFISRPFIWKSVLQGILAAILANGFLLLLVYRVGQSPDFKYLLSSVDPTMYLMVFGGVMLVGVIITWLSTMFSVKRFIRMKMDSLYMQ